MYPQRSSALVLLLTCLLAGCNTSAQRFDLIIRGGEVVDGTGQPPRRADVGVAGDRITQIGDLANVAAGRVIDATGLVVSPGFIDVQGQSGTSLLADGNGESHLRQGITSEIIGEGGSPAFWVQGIDDSDVAEAVRADLRLDRLLRLFRAPARARHDDQSRHVRAGDDGAPQHYRHGQPGAHRRRSCRGWKRWSIRRCAMAHSDCRAR